MSEQPVADPFAGISHGESTVLQQKTTLSSLLASLPHSCEYLTSIHFLLGTSTFSNVC